MFSGTSSGPKQVMTAATTMMVHASAIAHQRRVLFFFSALFVDLFVDSFV
jgi:hypothetical protein